MARHTPAQPFPVHVTCRMSHVTRRKLHSIALHTPSQALLGLVQGWLLVRAVVRRVHCPQTHDIFHKDLPLCSEDQWNHDSPRNIGQSVEQGTVLVERSSPLLPDTQASNREGHLINNTIPHSRSSRSHQPTSAHLISTVQYCTVRHCNALSCSVLSWSVLSCSVLHSTVMYRTMAYDGYSTVMHSRVPLSLAIEER